MLITDTRTKLITHWLEHTLKLEVSLFEPASSDASFRRYFRVVHTKGQHIVMDAPPEKEDIEPFIRIAALFKKSGVNVPLIYQQNLEQGFLLLEDFGSVCYLDQLSEQKAHELYLSAFNSLHTLQTQVSTINSPLPSYTPSLLENELTLFYEWFLEKKLNISIPEEIKKNLNQLLISSAIEQRQVCVHRDFHSRNLMVLTGESPGIIDFQDAVIGPITYDLVSLLRDCYITWPEEKIKHWVTLYLQKITMSGLSNASLVTFRQWFDLMGLQRHLKAIGIFSRLHLRDNKPSYLQDIPRTINYLKLICSHYSELTEFNQFLTDIILPAYSKHQLAFNQDKIA